ncbi:MAG: 23S rRNA (adenine(2503)-C(2))-methyltransferase RlmN [Candidatus Zixiibacteriota bacterium]
MNPSQSENLGQAQTSVAIPASQNILGHSVTELERAVGSCGAEPFHGRQLYRWMYNRRVYDFSSMSDLSQPLRKKLAQRFRVEPLQSSLRQTSTDRTEKHLFTLKDGVAIETVLIPDKNTRTVCLSSQAGCPLGCKFCATGTLNLKRDLTVGEIVGQALALRDDHGDEAFTNVVFMGMGEPLLNYRNLISALEIMTAPDGLAIAPRRITVSTAGITPKIRRLSESGLNVDLALSLHAATQRKREELMPVARTFALEGLIEEIRNYSAGRRRRITCEYVLLEGVNDSADDVRDLARLLSGVNCKVNVLSYNPAPGLNFVRPSDEKVDWFARGLSRAGVLVTVRTSRGRDISAACGQLAATRVGT